ncbi:MAG: dinitrogenase iron-molybdenum cofactor biosynthesis protein [Euryarchaeota archaeon]|nr:dinitrogenase iron-molybdenum cofactor biosynthesis protein [Euryarchaeota archaeon]
MKICIPTEGNNGLSEAVCAHFGQADTFTLYDTDTGDVRVIENRSEHKGGLGTPPQQLHKENVEIVLAGGLGPKAVDMLQGFGIDVYVGANGTVQDTIEEWRKGNLAKATYDNACRDHAH